MPGHRCIWPSGAIEHVLGDREAVQITVGEGEEDLEPVAAGCGEQSISIVYTHKGS